MSIKPDVVLRHWASAKIARARPTTVGMGQDAELGADEDVCKSIVEKFEKLDGLGVSYADIAKRAWEVGRAGLATKVSLFCHGRFYPAYALLGSDTFSSLITSQWRQIKYHYY